MNLHPGVCPCGATFATKHQDQKYCSRACLYAAQKVAVADRFWTKVDMSAGPAGCWRWRACVGPDGYGRLMVQKRPVGAHRIAYELLVGPIPAGLELDHLCRNRGCCNPAHLEPVTHRENALRGVGFGGINAKKTHCPHGHPYEGANVYRDANGERRCRECHRQESRQRAAQQREANPRQPRTHCKHGHPISPENTYVHRGRRYCIGCRRLGWQRDNARRSLVRLTVTPTKEQQR
jgi:hypothetical protein